DPLGEARCLDQRRRALVQGDDGIARLQREPVAVAVDQPQAHAAYSSSTTRIDRGGERRSSRRPSSSSAAAKRDSRHSWITITSRASAPVPRWTTLLTETSCSPSTAATRARTPG